MTGPVEYSRRQRKDAEEFGFRPRIRRNCEGKKWNLAPENKRLGGVSVDARDRHKSCEI